MCGRNPKVNVYHYLMAMNPHVQHSLLLFRELRSVGASEVF